MTNLVNELINEENNEIEIPEDFGGEPKKEWSICINIARGFSLKFDEPVSFKDAVAILEDHDLGAKPFDALVGEDLLMYDVGYLLEGEVDAEALKKLN